MEQERESGAQLPDLYGDDYDEALIHEINTQGHYGPPDATGRRPWIFTHPLHPNNQKKEPESEPEETRAQMPKTAQKDEGRTAEVIPISSRPRAQKEKGAQSRGSKSSKLKTKQLSAVRPRAQANEGADAETLKSWLNESLPGWWDVTENGKGFVMAFRWRSAGGNPKQPFPRLSRKAYQTLKEMQPNERKHELTERIAGHLEELCLDPGRRDRARIVAQRIGIELENDSQLVGQNRAG